MEFKGCLQRLAGSKLPNLGGMMLEKGVSEKDSLRLSLGEGDSYNPSSLSCLG